MPSVRLTGLPKKSVDADKVRLATLPQFSPVPTLHLPRLLTEGGKVARGCVKSYFYYAVT